MLLSNAGAHEIETCYCEMAGNIAKSIGSTVCFFQNFFKKAINFSNDNNNIFVCFLKRFPGSGYVCLLQRRLVGVWVSIYVFKFNFFKINIVLYDRRVFLLEVTLHRKSKILIQSLVLLEF